MFFGFCRNYCSVFEKMFFCKNEKKEKVPSRPFLTHAAAGPETQFYFSLASPTGDNRSEVYHFSFLVTFVLMEASMIFASIIS